MKLHSIKPKAGATKATKRLVRGNASGHGTFSGRGCKGQGQRKSGNVRPGFEGGQTPIFMRLPKLRGFNPLNKVSYQVVNLEALAPFEEGVEVTPETLFKKRLVASAVLPVKILGDGKLTKKLTFKVQALSRSARDKILAAGGKIL